MTDVCVRLAARGIARVFQLHVGERLVATQIGFEMDGCLYQEHSPNKCHPVACTS
jgi:hypothetical protein